MKTAEEILELLKIRLLATKSGYGESFLDGNTSTSEYWKAKMYELESLINWIEAE